jgi:Subtilase family/Peptidase inhibitor I9
MKPKSIIILAFAAMALGGPGLAVTANEASVEIAQATGPAKPSGVRRARRAVPNSYVVVLAPGEDPGAVGREVELLYAGQVRRVYRKSLNGFAVRLSPAAAERLADDPRVSFVEEDGVMTLDQAAVTWGQDRIDQRALPLDSIFQVNATGAGVVVHVLDTGIRTTHTEFGGRASIAADYVGDGFAGVDCHGHGTHVAGTIGGASYGVARNVTIYAHRVLNCLGNGSTAGVIAAVEAVAVDPARPAVANMSLGGDASFALDEAVRNSIAAGVTFVVAAGNQNSDALNFSPARVAEAVTVGATDEFDQRAWFSNYGTGLDLFGPGVNVLSAWWDSDSSTNVISGTSMASPHVAGAAALYLEVHPTATPEAVRDALVAAATPGVVVFEGPGSPNLLLFVGDEGTPSDVDLVTPNGGEKLFAGTPYTIKWTASDPDGLGSFDVMFSIDSGATFWPVPECTDLPGTARTCLWNSPGPTTNKARIKVIAHDSLGSSGYGESGSNFSMLSGSANVKVTVPNTAVSWVPGTSQLITWTHNLGVNSYMRVELSRNGGATFPEVLAASVKNAGSSSGSYLWSVTGPSTTAAIVKVSWTNGARSDVSNTTFSIGAALLTVRTPDSSNDDWGYGSLQRVKWTSSLGVGATVNVQMSTDGGLTYPLTLASNRPASAQQADVTTPTLSSPTTTARVRVVWSNPPAGLSASAVSSNFKVTPPFLYLLKPNGGETWTIGGSAKITWKSNLGPQERVRLELSTNGGGTFGTVIVGSTPSDGAFPFAVDPGWSTLNAKVRVIWLLSGSVADVSDATFRIQ